MKKKSRKKTGAAAAVMILMLLAALFLGMLSSVSKMKGIAEDSFYSDENGYSVHMGVEIRQKSAIRLLSVAEDYQNSYPELTEPSAELKSAIEALDNAWFSDDGSEAEKNLALSEPCRAVRDLLLSVDIKDADEKIVQNNFAEITAAQDRINRSSYNDDAAEFNKSLYKYPAKLLKDLGIVKALPVYYGK